MQHPWYYSCLVFTARRLKIQLHASAAGMSSPEWDGHRRLTDQLSADQDAAAAAAAAAAVPVPTTASVARGRSQSRAARSGHADDGSRSRSRSFNIPLRGWGGGNKVSTDRRQRWGSQEWDPPRGRHDSDIEEEVGRYGPGGGGGSESSGPHGSDPTNFNGSGGVGGRGATEEELGERPARGRSFFGFGGRAASNLRYGGGGGALSRLTPAVVSRPAAAMGDSSDESEEEDSVADDSQGLGGKTIASFGRRRATSMAGGVGGGGGNSKSRNSRFSSFSGERPSSSVAPSMHEALGHGNAAQTAVNFNPAAQANGRDDGTSRMGRSRSMIDPRFPTSGAHVYQQQQQQHQEMVRFPASKKKGWGRGRSSSAAGALGDEEEPQGQRRMSSAVEAREEFADGRIARRGSRLSSQVSYATGSASMGSDSNVGGGGKLGKWPFSRNKKRGSGGVGAGTSGGDGRGGRGGRGRSSSVPRSDVKRGVWGSLQVRLSKDWDVVFRPAHVMFVSFLTGPRVFVFAV